jgi:hypothetical protein
MIFENRCTKDGETYNPENVWDEHFVRADGTECGAAGEHIGTWGVEPVDAALLGPDGFPCEGCEGTSGMPPVTDKGFCAACAARAHEDGYGSGYVGEIPDRAAVYLGEAVALGLSTDAAYDVASNLLDVGREEYANEFLRRLWTLGRAAFFTDDDFDDFRAELREALGEPIEG